MKAIAYSKDHNHIGLFFATLATSPVCTAAGSLDAADGTA